MGHAKIEIYTDKGGKYRLRFKDEEGNILAASPISNSWATEAREQAETIKSKISEARVEVAG